jgi:hypothetical protein
MTLPATMAEALAFAREWIARMRQGNFMGLGGTPLDAITGHAFARRWCRLCAELHPQALNKSWTSRSVTASVPRMRRWSS